MVVLSLSGGQVLGVGCNPIVLVAVLSIALITTGEPNGQRMSASHIELTVETLLVTQADKLCLSVGPY